MAQHRHVQQRGRVAAGAPGLVPEEAGAESLAGLAAELGFADQAHLTRTVRAQLGDTPGRLRRLLG
ncbi:helix-turn-helix domain-containing protein [Micromonospora sp. AP08]|uniref:helix-turn-helix domain-containing protein n=1 Tax=Micromonospora sp. AP08 TaxID=2604467 RepID=UPI001CA315D6|nr:helix-turn-helix domain-containing protein [Micromonospora sp. AP08]